MSNPLSNVALADKMHVCSGLKKINEKKKNSLLALSPVYRENLQWNLEISHLLNLASLLIVAPICTSLCVLYGVFFLGFLHNVQHPSDGASPLAQVAQKVGSQQEQLTVSYVVEGPLVAAEERVALDLVHSGAAQSNLPAHRTQSVSLLLLLLLLHPLLVLRRYSSSPPTAVINTSSTKTHGDEQPEPPELRRIAKVPPGGKSALP